jgi:hypothetical protein
MYDDMSPECQALVQAAAGMGVDELAAELAKSSRELRDARALAAYLISMAG